MAKAEGGWQPGSESPSWADHARADSLPDALDATVIAGIRDLQDGDDDLLIELIDIFVHDVPLRLAELNAAVGRGDAVVLRSAAHSLKGSSGSLGAQHMAALCHRLELDGRAGVIDTAGELVAEIAREFDRVRVALDAERGK